jgi:hypothetical protein
MAARRNKHVIKAAKDAVTEKFSARLAELQDRYDELIAAGNAHSDDVDALVQQIHETTTEWDEWKVRSKKNKRKVGKRVEWTNRREQAPTRTVNQDVLKELRESRREKAKPEVGVSWLYEGALVIQRGKTDMMIVTRIAGGKVECLSSGATKWYRNVSLRPADWMMED